MCRRIENYAKKEGRFSSSTKKNFSFVLLIVSYRNNECWTHDLYKASFLQEYPGYVNLCHNLFKQFPMCWSPSQCVKSNYYLKTVRANYTFFCKPYFHSTTKTVISSAAFLFFSRNNVIRRHFLLLVHPGEPLHEKKLALTLIVENEMKVELPQRFAAIADGRTKSSAYFSAHL